MALPVREQVLYWGAATVVFLAVLWVLDDVILPFILGAAIAYFLDPVADRLETLGCSRALATGIITFFALLVFILVALLVIPTLVSQTGGLIQAAPMISQQLQTFVLERFPDIGYETQD